MNSPDAIQAVWKRLMISFEGKCSWPPGSGKSHTGARMVLALIRQGKRVGITGPSHKVISNLIDKAQEAADREAFFLESYQNSP